MVSWSSLKHSFRNVLKQRYKFLSSEQKTAPVCNPTPHYNLHVVPSRFQWTKFKDLVHFYVMLGVIPITVIILYCNIFIGPAQLDTKPDDYEPKHWEYHRHPISRFIARYLHPSPQQEYEKALHYLYEEKEKAEIRKLEAKIRRLMSERKDYQAYYYRPATAKYVRVSKENADELAELRGDN